LRGPAERAHPISRSAGALKLEGDLPQRPHWIHEL
jgi:hypothetical protein